MSTKQYGIWNKDTTYFAVCFIVGAAALVIFRWPGILDLSALLAALFLCGVILIYACIIWYLGRYRLRRDEGAADNLYFLGFIFTVSALGVSLYRYYVAESGSTPIEQIMGDLGIGISTTVLGLFLRVIFLSRDDPADLEDRVRRELVDVADDTISSIRQTGDILDRGIAVLQQTVSEVQSSMRELDQGVKKQSKNVASNLEQLGIRIESFEIPPDVFEEKLEPAIDSATTSIVEFSNKVNQMAIPTDSLPKQLDNVFQGVEKSAQEQLRRVSSEFEKGIELYVKSMQDRSYEIIEGIEKTIISQMQNFSIPEEEVQRFRAKMLSEFSNQSKEMTDASIQVADAMRSLVKSMNDSEKELREAPGSLFSSFDTIQGGITEVFEQLKIRFESLASTISALDMEQVVNGMKEVEKLSKESSQAISEHHKSNIELSESLTEFSGQLRSLQDTLHNLSHQDSTRSGRWPWSLRRG